MTNRLAAWNPEDWDLAPGWRALVSQFLASPDGQRLAAFLRARLEAGARIYPAQPLRALALTAPESVKVLILGQDPYHGDGQAEGLAFSVCPGIRVPPSLANIHRELARDLGANPPGHGSLVAWARQGVLLLNTVLTVEDGRPASHAAKGWEALTDSIIRHLSRDGRPRVYMLWGNHAQAKRPLIESVGVGSGPRPSARLVLVSNHPSPLSARRPPIPFLGNGHFGAASRWLQAAGVTLDWRFDGPIEEEAAEK